MARGRRRTWSGIPLLLVICSLSEEGWGGSRSCRNETDAVKRAAEKFDGGEGYKVQCSLNPLLYSVPPPTVRSRSRRPVTAREHLLMGRLQPGCAISLSRLPGLPFHLLRVVFDNAFIPTKVQQGLPSFQTTTGMFLPKLCYKSTFRRCVPRSAPALPSETFAPSEWGEKITTEAARGQSDAPLILEGREKKKKVPYLTPPCLARFYAAFDGASVSRAAKGLRHI